MNSPHEKSVLRLRKRHGRGEGVEATAADGGRLVNAQSFRHAVVFGLIAIIVFSLFWVTLSALLNKVFPWFTVVLGIFLGFAIRLTGRGLDWRFPTLAAVLALTGSLIANVIVAASVTAEVEGTATLHVLQSVTTMTWPVFFDKVLTVADGFFAVVAAGFAAFYANRKLTRKQYYALRLWREENNE
ncbi:MAG TPA: hypothetical protein PKH39_05120 [Woeseiaceae bacterium]|nr:hypothetical protein [Woeseiaceae bacterium]